jgi:hypothetical protein
MAKKLSLVIIPVLLALSAFLVFYISSGAEYINSAYEGNSPSWFNTIVETFYPRFFAEKNRLEIDFFITKANQVALRLSLVVLLSLVFYIWWQISDRFKQGLTDFTGKTTTIHNIYILRILFYLILIIATRDVYQDLQSLRFLEEFYKPLGMLNILHLPFPGKQVSFLIYGFLFLSAILVIFGIKPVFFSCTAISAFILYQAYLFSFEKIDHGYAPFTYAAMIFPFLLWERYLAKKQGNISFISWSLKLIIIVTCMVYFFSGLEKLLMSGFSWLDPETFRTYLYIHNTDLGMKIIDNTFLMRALPFLAWILQLSFPLILFYDRAKYIILPIGIAFHIGTVMLLGISSLENPWLFNYIFFFDWSKLGKKLAILPAYFRS